MHDELISIGRPLPRILTVRVLQNFEIEIAWNSGQKSTCDLAPILASRKIFSTLLAEPTLFMSVSVNDDGNALIWGNGAEISAVWLEQLSLTRFSNSDFRTLMDNLGLTLEGMAATLEVSRRQIASYRKDKPIPKHIALASRYLAEKFSATNQ